MVLSFRNEVNEFAELAEYLKPNGIKIGNG